MHTHWVAKNSPLTKKDGWLVGCLGFMVYQPL